MKTVVEPTREAVVAALGDTRTVVTIGAYDGVHLGHRAVIAQVRERATSLGARSVVVTFDRHPASVVRPESAPKLLTDPQQKLELLASTGVDATLVVPFGESQSKEAPRDFVQRVLVDALRMRAVIVGEDFHFGHKRGGNVALLREAGVKVVIAQGDPGGEVRGGSRHEDRERRRCEHPLDGTGFESPGRQVGDGGAVQHLLPRSREIGNRDGCHDRCGREPGAEGPRSPRAATSCRPPTAP